MFTPDQMCCLFLIKGVFYSGSRELFINDQGRCLFPIKGVVYSGSRELFINDQGRCLFPIKGVVYQRSQMLFTADHSHYIQSLARSSEFSSFLRISFRGASEELQEFIWLQKLILRWDGEGVRRGRAGHLPTEATDANYSRMNTLEPKASSLRSFT